MRNHSKLISGKKLIQNSRVKAAIKQEQHRAKFTKSDNFTCENSLRNVAYLCKEVSTCDFT